MKKFEYTCDDTIFDENPLKVRDRLNSFGKAGWELVSMIALPPDLIFKKPRFLVTYKRELVEDKEPHTEEIPEPIVQQILNDCPIIYDLSEKRWRGEMVEWSEELLLKLINNQTLQAQIHSSLMARENTLALYPVETPSNLRIDIEANKAALEVLIETIRNG